MPNTVRSDKGFTLIELLMVVAIIAAISGGPIPAFSGYIREQVITQSKEQLKNDLRSVQNRALAGAMSEEEIGGNSVEYWGIRFVEGSRDYEYFISDVDSGCFPVNSTVQGRYTLPEDMEVRGSTFTGGNTSGCMFFSIEDGSSSSYSITSSGNFSQIILNRTGTNDCGRVEINAPGLIRISTSEDC